MRYFFIFSVVAVLGAGLFYVSVGRDSFNFAPPEATSGPAPNGGVVPGNPYDPAGPVAAGSPAGAPSRARTQKSERGDPTLSAGGRGTTPRGSEEDPTSPSGHAGADRERSPSTRAASRGSGNPAHRGPGSPTPPSSGTVPGSSKDDRENPGPVLRVWGANLETDLTSVTVVKGSRSSRNQIHPGRIDPSMVIFEEAASPIALPPATGTQTYWARAPGYSWENIVVDHQEGGERLLALNPGAGSLRITLENHYPEFGAVIRVHSERQQGPGVELIPDPSGSEVIAGLPPKKYFIRVEIGNQVWNSILLGEAEVDLNPGTELGVLIALDDPPDLTGSVILSGELGVPREWDEPEVEVTVKPLDVPTIHGKPEVSITQEEMGVAASGRLEWVAGAVVPGRYRISAQPFNLCKTVDVLESGVDPVIIDVPPPTEVVLRVEDRETGSVVPLTSISWWVPGSDVSGCRLAWEQRDSSDNRFRFRAPLGALDVANLFSNEWRVDRTNFSLAPHSNALTVKASPACGIRLSLFDGDVPIPQADLPRNITVRGASSTLRMVSWSVEGHQRVLRLSGAGRYQLIIPPISGFETIPPQEVDVAFAEFTELQIELVRGQ